MNKSTMYWGLGLTAIGGVGIWWCRTHDAFRCFLLPVLVVVLIGLVFLLKYSYQFWKHRK